MTIERSKGYDPGTPWFGPLPGGGFQGKTRKLDRAVWRFAMFLSETFKTDVQIRFNSNQLSGGAFITPFKDDKELGLTADLVTPKEHRDRWKRVRPGELWRLPRLEDLPIWNDEVPLHFNVLIHPGFLKNPTDLGEYTNASNPPFGCWPAKSGAHAKRLLLSLIHGSIDVLR